MIEWMFSNLLNPSDVDSSRKSTWWKMRWNEAKLAELRREMDESLSSRQRSSRLEAWRKVAQEAAEKNSAEVAIPDELGSFGKH